MNHSFFVTWGSLIWCFSGKGVQEVICYNVFLIFRFTRSQLFWDLTCWFPPQENPHFVAQSLWALEFDRDMVHPFWMSLLYRIYNQKVQHETQTFRILLNIFLFLSLSFVKPCPGNRWNALVNFHQAIPRPKHDHLARSGLGISWDLLGLVHHKASVVKICEDHYLGISSVTHTHSHHRSHTYIVDHVYV